MTPKKRLAEPFRLLTWSLALCLVGVLTLYSALDGPKALMIAGFCVWIVSGFAFYLALGVLASRLGRSWIVWVGMSMITNPIGPIVAYVRMRQLVENATGVATSGVRAT